MKTFQLPNIRHISPRKEAPASLLRNIWFEDIRVVVADTEWQALRKSFIGKWKRDPETNVKALRGFLERRKDDRALRCVYNYLTGSGFRGGVIKHQSIDILLMEVRNEVMKRKGLR